MTTLLRLAVLCLALAAVAADWPQILGPARNGHSSEKGLVDTWPKKGPEVVWQRTVGEGYASPVLAGGRLILLHHVGANDVVQSFDAVTGKPGWKYSYPCRNEGTYAKG